MRAWTLAFLVLAGCGQAAPPQDSAPVVDVDAAYERVLNPVPAPPPEPSPIGSALGSYIDRAAADAEKPQVTIEMLTATWCGPCKTAHDKIVPWLREKGYTVTETDCSTIDFAEKYGVKGLPTFIFRAADKELKVTGPRYDTRGNPYAPDFKEAFEKFPATKPVAFGMSVPAISVGDLTENLRGTETEVAGVVRVTVPKDLDWTVTKKPASVLLTFKEGKQPKLSSLKYVRANPSLLSVELSPYWAEFHTDSWWPMLKTVRVEFDWTPPSAIKKTQFTNSRTPYWRRSPQYQPVPQRPAPPVIKADDPQPEAEPTPAPLAINPEQPVIPSMRKAWLASVEIITLRPNGISAFGYQLPGYSEGYGSGFVIRSDGYIVTNHHVIDGCTIFKCQFCNGQQRPCKVVGFDEKADIAVLKVDETGLATMPVCVKPGLVAGTEVYTLGSPYGYGCSLCRGIVSNPSRTVDCGDSKKYEGLIQSDAAINPGNSGGVMLNVKGEAVGVCVAMRAGANKMGFAIPISRAMEAANKLVKP